MANISSASNSSFMPAFIVKLAETARLKKSIGVSQNPLPVQNLTAQSIKGTAETQHLNKIETAQWIADTITSQLKADKELPLNDPRQEEPGVAFIITNESDTNKAQATLKHWATKNHSKSKPTIHLGVGSTINYPMGLASRSDIILIADLDKRVIDFHKELLKLVKDIPEHHKLVAAITHHIKNTWEEIMGERLSDVDHSWLDPDSISKLREMVNQNRIMPLLMNINDAMDMVQQFKSDEALTPQQQPKVVVYSSNVGDWIRGRNSNTQVDSRKAANYFRFAERIDKAVADDGCHVYTTKDVRSRLDGGYIQQVIKGEAGLPSFKSIGQYT